MKKSLLSFCYAAAILISSVVPAYAADAIPAKPTRESGQEIYVDGVRVYPTGYNIGGNNYFKLRDIGKLVGFGVDWVQETQTVEISTERMPSTTEGITDTSVSGAAAKVSHQRIAVDGIYVNLKAYQIGGNNYVKLRDIGVQVNFGVNYDAANKRVVISPNLFYGEEVQESNVGNTGNSSSSATVTDEMLRQWELEMIDAVNAERRRDGVPELVIDFNIMQRAQWWAKHLTTEFRHTTWDEIEEFANNIGVDADEISGGENITGAGRLTGIGYDPMTLAMNNFMNSEGHRNTILNSDFTRIGVGFALAKDGNIYCCQNFGL